VEDTQFFVFKCLHNVSLIYAWARIPRKQTAHRILCINIWQALKICDRRSLARSRADCSETACIWTMFNLKNSFPVLLFQSKKWTVSKIRKLSNEHFCITVSVLSTVRSTGSFQRRMRNSSNFQWAEKKSRQQFKSQFMNREGSSCLQISKNDKGRKLVSANLKMIFQRKDQRKSMPCETCFTSTRGDTHTYT